MMMVILLVKYVTRNARAGRKLLRLKPKELASNCSGLYSFSKAEIENAINFAEEKKFLGRGSAGQVFKGILPSGQVVAIKQIYRSNTSDSFTRELENLSRVRHPNLVCLFGCCIEDGEQYLVYEYCSAGNLAQHLLRKDRVLSWEQRVRILRDCALALRYLHTYIDGYIVHRDIKLTNILLTEELGAKLSDFGLAKMLGMEESKVFTDVRGTIGYMDPEYMSNAKLTCASDVYSFGIVALQVLSGQKVIELDLDARDQLTRKAKDVSMHKRPLKDFEDPRLKDEINSEDFESILQIAVLCVAKSSKGRPTIDVVFEEMDKVLKNTLSNKKAADQSALAAVRKSHSVGVLPV
ncbi:putative serine/threonine-protein kinase [Lycium ferocissimum]|uniref:putative serine/threonine-protein kinase n=1 Tax=Lycium ferocissimum TaxID=112874 RepID=UPI002814B3C4|nr:putative serine/threonine-protein kinase [Lycium ferocissimum]